MTERSDALATASPPATPASPANDRRGPTAAVSGGAHECPPTEVDRVR